MSKELRHKADRMMKELREMLVPISLEIHRLKSAEHSSAPVKKVHL